MIYAFRIHHGDTPEHFRDVVASTECAAWRKYLHLFRHSPLKPGRKYHKIVRREYPQFYGYDGRAYTVGSRVELHPGTDLWMRGARHGEVVGCSPTPADRVKVKLDKLPSRVFCGSEDTFKVID